MLTGAWKRQSYPFSGYLLPTLKESPRKHRLLPPEAKTPSDDSQWVQRWIKRWVMVYKTANCGTSLYTEC